MKKRTIAIAVISTLIILVTIPTLILSLEENKRMGELYYFLAEKAFYQQDEEKARDLLKISLKNYPQNDLAEELNEKFTEKLKIPSNLTISHSVFDKIRNSQNKILSKFYKPSDDIPIYNIEITDENYDKLTSNLPASGKSYVKTKVTLPNGEKVKAEIRLRGDHYWHWENEKKSWRIKLDKKEDNQKILNLINPRHKSHVIYNIGYHLGEQAGLLSPEYNFVALNINGKYQGVYIQIEQVNEDFLANHDKKPGDIYFGEPAIGTTTSLDLEIGVYANTNLWQYKPANEEDTGDKRKNLEKLLNTVNKELDSSFEKEISEIIDLDQMIRYIAIQDIIGSNHIDSFHNFKIYFNPETQKFEPIVWDLFAWVNLNPVKSVNKTNNILFNKLLLIPKIREKKNQYIWEYIHNFAAPEKINNFIDNETEQIKNPLFFDPIKDYADDRIPQILEQHPVRPLSYTQWEKSLDYIKFWYQTRYEYLIEKFTENAITVYYDGAIITFDLNGESPYTITKAPPSLNGEILYPGLKEKEWKKDEESRIVKYFEEMSLRYQFEIRNLEPQIELKNNITGETFKAEIIRIESSSELPLLN